MLNATHFSVGLAIGRNVANPGTAFFLGLASHFFLDWFPHWDGVEPTEDGQIHWKTRKNLIAVGRDLAITAVIAWFAWHQGWLGFSKAYASVLWGILGATLPDILWIPYHVFGLRHPKHFFEFHRHIQNGAALIPGLAPQIALVTLALFASR